jgi:hypothetical protein
MTQTQPQTFDPSHLEDILLLVGPSADDWKWATAHAWETAITVPGIIRQTLDSPELVRRFASGLTWKRTFAWSRQPWMVPVGGLDQPHAKPAQTVVLVTRGTVGAMDVQWVRV